MTPRLLLFRSLVYYRGVHLAVALGVAVGTAVLAGALLVGDSVRGSLRDLTLDRLGAIDHALVAERYFREDLAGELAGADGFPAAFAKAAPAILIRGSVESGGAGARASGVNLHGVDARFWSMFAAAPPNLGAREVALNRSLARELGAGEGEAVLVRFQTDTLVPSESLMGRKTDNVTTLRLTVAAVLDDRGAGRFGLSPSQQLPSNAFLPLALLQRSLDQAGRANALFISGSPDAAGAQTVNALLDSVLRLDDLQLSIKKLPAGGFLSVETARVVLDAGTADAVEKAATQAGLRPFPVLTYLANSIEAGGRTIPYSTVTALDFSGTAAGDELKLVQGDAAPQLAGSELLLNEWAAKDLQAQPGDEVQLSYYVVGPQGSLETESHTFTLRGVVQMAGLAVDRNLAPEFKGMSNARRMGDWGPPFAVDLSKIRPMDEEYWDRYRTAPKAFVALETAKNLWTSRFGQLTSVRVTPPPGQSLDEAEAGFTRALRDQLDPATVGLAFQPVKAQGLAASSGATDFSGLFIGFSMFLIVAAAMLVALLFRLGIERRSKEIGLLLSTGQPVPLVRKLLLQEGAAIALLGCLLGLPGALAYGALMVHGLRTWWSDAVGGSFLQFHVTALSLAIGAAGALLVMVLSIWLAVRKLEQLSPRSMLAGVLEDAGASEPAARRGRKARLAAWLSAGLAALLLGLSLGTDAVPATAGFFGVGALSLIAALAWFRSRLLAPGGSFVRGKGFEPLARLGARNGARYPTRSVLSVGLVASATFVIVAVAVNRHDVTSQEPSFHSGDGGFRFIAESDLPLYQDQLTFADDAATPAMKVMPFRVQRGEDASCLNLYRPSRPTLLGTVPAMIERGGFAFQSSLADTAEEQGNPWLLLEKELPGGGIPVFGDANSVMWILHLGLGDSLEITDDRGRKRRLVIAGLLSRSIFQSQLVMSQTHFLDLFPGDSGFQLFLIETPSEAAGALLEERLAESGFDAVRAADRLASYLVVENTYLSTFQTLGGLGLLLGTLGLAVVMVRNVLERRGELSLLRAVGFPSSSISWLVLAENGFLLVFGVAIGALTALLAVTPHLLSGLAEPPWLSLSLTLAAIIAVGLVAGAAAVGASLRMPLVAGLRRE